MKGEVNQIKIQAIRRRQGWEEHFAAMAEQADDRLLDETLPTQWDEEEWIWENSFNHRNKADNS